MDPDSTRFNNPKPAINLLCREQPQKIGCNHIENPERGVLRQAKHCDTCPFMGREAEYISEIQIQSDQTALFLKADLE